MLKLLSPAKVNLFLRILRKRDDGYHELASLFQTIDLCDTLELHLTDRDCLTCSDPDLPTDENNLVLKAVRLFRQHTNIKASIKIHLEKKIPQQAGLGGGSSNAATTLWAMNELFDRPVSQTDLKRLGAEIGSDVPFFLSCGTAYCTGRGEQLRELSPLPPMQMSIIKPREGLSTPLVYRNLDVASLPPRDPEMALAQFISGKPVFFNDLESAAFKVLPSLIDFKQNLLDAGFSTVLMSGSGSSFFCLGNGVINNDMTTQHYKVRFTNRLINVWY